MPSLDRHITLRDFSSQADYDACVALQDETWGRDFAERVPAAILRVAQKIGGVAAGGFDADGRLFGFVFGMTGVRDGRLVHWSDMLAVHPDARGTGLAARLKQHQRDVVQAHGVALMVWTADPLVAGNAHFNINRLGARPVEYVVNMYGAKTGSVLHGSMPTDRAVYHWALDDPASHGAVAGAPSDGDAALPAAVAVDARGWPVAINTPGATGVRVSVPHDLEAVQQADVDLALAWRLAVREAFGRLHAGFTVARFVRAAGGQRPYYVLTRD